MLKISPILSHIRKPIYTGHNTTCPLKPLQKDVFTRSGEISFSSSQALSVPEIEGKPVVFETKVAKKIPKSKEYQPVSVYLTKPEEKNKKILPGYWHADLYELEKENNPKKLGRLIYRIDTEKEGKTLYICLLERCLHENEKTDDYKGIGTALLRISFQISQALGLSGRIRLTACHMNHNLNKSHPALFYYKHGFRCFDKAINDELANYLAQKENENEESSQGFQHPNGIEMYLPRENVKILQKRGEEVKWDEERLKEMQMARQRKAAK